MGQQTNAGAAPAWRWTHLVAALSVAALAFTVLPGCAWLFGFPRPGTPESTIEPGGGQQGAAIVYPAAPPEMLSGPSHFLERAEGFRNLGAAMIYDGRLILLPAPPAVGLTERDQALGLAFGRAVLAHYIDRLDFMTHENCVGDGARPDSAIRVVNLARAADEIRGGIGCVRLRNPGASWIGSTLMLADAQPTTRAVSLVLLQRQDGGRVGAYVDVSDFAAMTLRELP